MMDAILEALASAVESQLKVSFDARAYTDKNGDTWITTSTENRYEKRNALIRYDANKPIQYYVNFLAGLQ